MDSDESEAIRAEELDPDDRAMRAALDLVRWELDLRLARDADVTGAQRVRLERAVIVGTRR